MLKKLLSDPASKWICLGWAGFTLENLILSENRTEIIEYFDNATYHRVYNTLSTLACASVAFGYLRYRPGVKYLKHIRAIRFIHYTCCGDIRLSSYRVRIPNLTS